MFKDISTLKKELKRIKYSSITPSGSDIIAERVANLKANDEKFKDWSDEEIEEYVRLEINRQNHTIAKNNAKLLSTSNRPDYPEWNQYTYDQILQMKEQGVSIPSDLLEWAYSMANTDIVSYEIDTESISDTSELGEIDTAANVNGSTLETKKVLQKIVSKETAQENLLATKNEDLATTEAQVAQKQEGLQAQQDLTLKKIEELQQEFRKLEEKLQSGETLSDDEISRYQELGTLLSVQGKALQIQTQNMETEINTLLSEMDNVSEIIDVNKNLTETAERMQRSYSSAEAYQRGSLYAPKNSGIGISGETSVLYYSALTTSLSLNTGNATQALAAALVQTTETLNKNASLASIITGKIVTSQKNNTENLTPNTNIPTNNDEEVMTEVPENTTTDEQTDVPSLSSTAQTTAQTAATTNQETTPSDGITATNGTVPTTETEATTETTDTPSDGITATNGTVPTTETEATTETTDTPSDGITATNGMVSTTETKATTETTDTPSDGITATNGTVPTTETEATTETTDTTTEETANDEETKMNDYISGITEKTTAINAFTTQFTNLKQQTVILVLRAKQDSEKFEKNYEAKVGEYKALLNKLSGNKPEDKGQQFMDMLKYGVNYNSEFSEDDMNRYNELKAELDTENGTFATELNAKLAILGAFGAAFQSGIEMLAVDTEYAQQAIEDGKAYALNQTGISEEQIGTLIHLFGEESEIVKNILYGKSGESLGRDVMDGGEALLGLVNATQNTISSSTKLNEASIAMSADLTQRKADMSTEIGEMNAQFEEIFAQQDAENIDENGEKKTSEKKDNTEEPDAAAVEKQGQQAEQSGKKAEQEGKEAEKDEAAYKKEMKREETALKKTQRQIKNEQKKMQEANAQIEAGNAEIDTYYAAITTLSATSKNATASTPKTNEKTTNNNQTVSNTTNNSTQLATANAYMGQIDQLSQNNTRLGQVITSSGQTVTVLQKKSTKTQKMLVKTSKAKQSAAIKKQKDAEQEAKNKQKPIQTVTTIGYVFTGIKMVGLGLMAFPLTAAIGSIMYGVGTYGELACYATNMALNISQGNWLGAGICLAAAAASFLMGPNPTESLTEGIKQLSTEAAKEGAKNMGTTAIKETVVEGVKEGVEEGAKEGVKQVVTEGVKEGVEEGTKQISEQVILENIKNSSSTLITDTLFENAKQAMIASAEKSMAELSAKIALEASKKLAVESIKQSLKESALSLVGNASQLAGSVLSNEKEQEEEKKITHTAQNRKKAREAVKRGLNKVKSKKNAQNAK